MDHSTTNKRNQEIQLTLEQHEFELCGSTYTWISFQPNVVKTQYSLDAKLTYMEDKLSVYVCKTWVCTDFVIHQNPGTKPSCILRNDCTELNDNENTWCQNLYDTFQMVVGGNSLLWK